MVFSRSNPAVSAAVAPRTAAPKPKLTLDTIAVRRAVPIARPAVPAHRTPATAIGAKIAPTFPPDMCSRIPEMMFDPIDEPAWRP